MSTRGPASIATRAAVAGARARLYGDVPYWARPAGDLRPSHDVRSDVSIHVSALWSDVGYHYLRDPQPGGAWWIGTGQGIIPTTFRDPVCPVAKLDEIAWTRYYGGIGESYVEPTSASVKWLRADIHRRKMVTAIRGW